ncbi:Transglutaminase-like superfamily protein [Seinonella peptonophila]|uniref:Transglutaminase-like superfamily protein n=1 Tax=Seinonella peptonophila TaxID=112248 RepID=A0A1M5BDE4_9BACL|nr:transglutaminase family protein [Seinonella peptonophila]SHF40468.1 Transglutaminase-like superfamily protein [Seinonella peptonophila]
MKKLKLIPITVTIDDYLKICQVVDFNHEFIQKRAKMIAQQYKTTFDRIKATYHFVRDEIQHSWDIQSHRITCRASEVLRFGEGICYAKSHLLAALLRAQEIPTGFCYQRLTLLDEPDSGFAIHALNAVYIQSIQRWVRLDARGNKPGVHAQFSLTEEKLAFPIREELGEIDYPTIFAKPLQKTIEVLQEHTDCLDMYLHGLPTYLSQEFL